MRNKREKEAILRAALVKYCKQIGVVDCEIPELVFYGEEFKERSAAATSFERYRHPNPGGGSRYTTYSGIGDPWSRLIFVNLRDSGGKRRRKTGLRELRHTLVHELVHYRFAYMSHGKAYEKRIKDILRGKQYPRKHIDIPNYEGLTGFV